MKVCFAAIAAIFVVLQAVYLDTATGQEEDKVVVNGKRKPNYRQLVNIWRAASGINWTKLMRLVFHQCVGTSCNACVDPNDPENKGFEKLINQLHKIQRKPAVFPFMTMSDLIPFLLMPRWNFAILQNNLEARQCRGWSMPTPKWRYWWGRPDGCEYIYTKVNGTTPNGFPGIRMSREELFDWFKKDFNFEPAEAMLLIAGGHGVGGRAHLNVSGYDGRFFIPKMYGWPFNNRVFKWTTGQPRIRYKANRPNSTTDKFFQTIVHEYSGRRVGILLDTDIHPMYKIDRDPLKDLQCRISDNVFSKKDKIKNYPLCERSELFDLAKEYAKDNLKFMNDFFDLYTRMLAKGNEGKLHELKVPYLKPRKMGFFLYLYQEGKECYKGASKDLIKLWTGKLAESEKVYNVTLEAAEKAIEEASETVKEANNEDAGKILNDAKMAKETAEETWKNSTMSFEVSVKKLKAKSSRPVRKKGAAAGRYALRKAEEAVAKAKKVLTILDGLNSLA